MAVQQTSELGDHVKKLGGIMEFLRESFAGVIHDHQEDKKNMEMVQATLNVHNEPFRKVEARLEALSSDPDRSTHTIRTVARNQYAALELNTEAEVRRLSSRISSSPGSSSSTSAPAPSTATSVLGNIEMLGGIRENIPEEEALRIAKGFLHHAGVLPAVPAEARRRWTSAVHFKSPCPEHARSFASTVRDLPTRGYQRRQFWATIRATKERRTRNRKLLRAAEALQKYSKLANVQNKKAFNLVVCCRSSSIVLGSRKVLEVREPDNNYSRMDDWYSADLYAEKKEAIVAEIMSIE